MTEDERWMLRALELAERGRGAVEPNPVVGAVVVRSGQCVGDGFHARFGAAHAEIEALAAAGEQARGATLYVTLEPCRHFGKTPPCTAAIRHAGIARVVAAIEDPFPEMAGRGFAELRAAGIEVTIGPGADEARRQNAPYRTLIQRGRPYVHAKWAMSLDGRIATRRGESQWISGPAARARTHQLRGRMDAIIVGAGTVRADDPLLTARPPGPRQAARVVLVGGQAIPAPSRLLHSPESGPVILAVGVRPAEPPPAGVEVLPLPDADGRPAVTALLAELGRRRMTNVLVEGGAAALGSFFDAGLIDEFHVLIAPKLLGGGLSPIDGAGADRLAETRRLARWICEPIGDDLYVHGWME